MQVTAQKDPDLGSRLMSAKLPALPQVLLQLLELSERDDVELGRIAAVVNSDSGIAAKVVNVANSAYFNRGRSVTNIHQCLAVLGTGQVRRIALNLSVATLFGSFNRPSGFDLGRYWHHVLTVALLARGLANKLAYPHVDEAYLAGLLHDIGQLALLSVEPDRYLALFEDAEGEAELHHQEKQQLGLTHAMAGAMLAQKWNLNPFFIDGLLYHHEEAERLLEAHPLAQILALADWLAVRGDEETRFEHILIDHAGLASDDLLALLATAREEAKALADEMGIELAPAKGKKVRADQTPQARLADALSQRLEGQGALPEDDRARPLAELHRSLLRSAKMLFETTTAALFTQTDNVLIGHPASEEDTRIAEIRIPASAANSAIAKAMRGTIAIAGGNLQEESLADAQVIHAFGCQHLLCLPLTSDGVCQGVLAVGLKGRAAQDLLQRQILLRSFSREIARRLASANQGVSAGGGISDTDLRKAIHEVSNPLSVVRNYINVLREQLAEKKQAQQDCDLVEGELRRVARILEQLKSPTPLAGKAGKTGRVSVNTLLEEVARLARIGRPDFERIETQFNLDPALPMLAGDADKLKQVVINLVFNAAEAMPDGGRIVLGSAQTMDAQGLPQVEITIQDNGPGLPAAVLDHLFQPVQTTKGGQHQGLGLTIVAKLIDELGGTKQCHSSTSGTTFRIVLPA